MGFGIGDLAGEIIRIQRLIQCLLHLCRMIFAQFRSIGIHMQRPDECPVPVHRRVPVEGAVEDRGQLSGNVHVGGAGIDLPVIEGVRPLNAGEGHFRQFPQGSLKCHGCLSKGVPPILRGESCRGKPR